MTSSMRPEAQVGLMLRAQARIKGEALTRHLQKARPADGQARLLATRLAHLPASKRLQPQSLLPRHLTWLGQQSQMGRD